MSCNDSFKIKLTMHCLHTNYIYRYDLALNNPQGLTYQPTNQPT